MLVPVVADAMCRFFLPEVIDQRRDLRHPADHATRFTPRHRVDVEFYFRKRPTTPPPPTDRFVVNDGQITDKVARF